MKKLILITVCAIYSSGAWSQNTVSLNSNGNDANQQAAVITSDSECMAYLLGAEEEITNNDKHLASLLTKLVNDKAEGNKKVEREMKKLIKNILILQACNDELKTDLNNYKNYGDGDWKLFKKEFNRELSELGREINELRIKIYGDFIVENLR